MERQRNYFEGKPRSQAAVDAVLGSIAGSFVGAVAGALLTGGSAGGRTVGALAGAVGGAAWAAGRKRAGFTETQRAQARKGAAYGSIIPGVGAAGGTFFWTD